MKGRLSKETLIMLRAALMHAVAVIERALFEGWEWVPTRSARMQDVDVPGILGDD